VRWSETLSEEFKLEDAPSDRTKTPVDTYMKLADAAKKKSVELRDQYYSGQGQEKQAHSVSIVGRVPRTTPNR
jgi:hypothetical protein